MRGPLHRVAGLEARRAEADRVRAELKQQVVEETAATYTDLFERVLSSAGLTTKQKERARARLVEELQVLLAPGSKTA